MLALCDRSRRVALIGESLLSIAEEGGRVATMDYTVASLVVTVSSCLVMDASPLSEEHTNRMRRDSPWDRSLSCLSLGMGICSGVKRSLSRVSRRKLRRSRRFWEGTSTTDKALEEGRDGNTTGMSGRLSIVGTDGQGRMVRDGWSGTRSLKGGQR